MSYLITSTIREAAKENDHGAAMAIFLQEQVGSIYGKWEGGLGPADQRFLFGNYIGSGRLRIDGATETVTMMQWDGGADYVEAHRETWGELIARADKRPFPLWNPYGKSRAYYDAEWAEIKKYEGQTVVLTLVDGTKEIVEEMQAATCTGGVGIKGVRGRFGAWYGPEEFIAVEVQGS